MSTSNASFPGYSVLSLTLIHFINFKPLKTVSASHLNKYDLAYIFLFSTLGKWVNIYFEILLYTAQVAVTS